VRVVGGRLVTYCYKKKFLIRIILILIPIPPSDTRPFPSFGQLGKSRENRGKGLGTLGAPLTHLPALFLLAAPRTYQTVVNGLCDDLGTFLPCPQPNLLTPSPMPDNILNNLTRAQLAAIQETVLLKKGKAPCLNCGTPFLNPRPNKRFCNASCKSAYHDAAFRDHLDTLIREKAQWAQERETLIREIANLRAFIQGKGSSL
jgi:hypothetical protein